MFFQKISLAALIANVCKRDCLLLLSAQQHFALVIVCQLKAEINEAHEALHRKRKAEEIVDAKKAKQMLRRLFNKNLQLYSRTR